MMRPGATMRKPCVKFLLAERRAALTVCHAMSMAMTVVLPAPVASFNASRMSSGGLLFEFEFWFIEQLEQLCFRLLHLLGRLQVGFLAGLGQ